VQRKDKPNRTPDILHLGSQQKARPPILPSLIIITALATTYNGTTAQPQYVAQSPFTTPIDEGVADIGPLGVGRHRLDVDFNVSRRFDQVFALPTGLGPDGSTPMFARTEGAITAVFPRSVYRPLRDRRGRVIGVGAPIPPGTIFYIGDLPEHLLGPSQQPNTHDNQPKPNITFQPSKATTQVSTKLTTSNHPSLQPATIHQPPLAGQHQQSKQGQVQTKVSTYTPPTQRSQTQPNTPPAATQSTPIPPDHESSPAAPPSPDMANDAYRAKIVNARLAELAASSR